LFFFFFSNVGAEYRKNLHLVRADTFGNEVEWVVSQIKEKVAEIQSAAA